MGPAPASKQQVDIAGAKPLVATPVYLPIPSDFAFSHKYCVISSRLYTVAIVSLSKFDLRLPLSERFTSSHPDPSALDLAISSSSSGALPPSSFVGLPVLLRPLSLPGLLRPFSLPSAAACGCAGNSSCSCDKDWFRMGWPNTFGDACFFLFIPFCGVGSPSSFLLLLWLPLGPPLLLLGLRPLPLPQPPLRPKLLPTCKHLVHTTHGFAVHPRMSDFISGLCLRASSTLTPSLAASALMNMPKLNVSSSCGLLLANKLSMASSRRLLEMASNPVAGGPASDRINLFMASTAASTKLTVSSKYNALASNWWVKMQRILQAWSWDSACVSCRQSALPMAFARMKTPQEAPSV